MGTETVWLPAFFKIYIFCDPQKNKVIQVWNNMRVSKYTFCGSNNGK